MTRLMGSLLSICLFIPGLAVVVYQIYFWLRNGVWFGISVLDALKYFYSPRNWPWLWYPDYWMGFHNILDKFPLFLFLLLFAFFLVQALEGSIEDVQRERRLKKTLKEDKEPEE